MLHGRATRSPERSTQVGRNAVEMWKIEIFANCEDFFPTGLERVLTAL
jgi:hypothetical protein